VRPQEELRRVVARICGVLLDVGPQPSDMNINSPWLDKGLVAMGPAAAYSGSHGTPARNTARIIAFAVMGLS